MWKTLFYVWNSFKLINFPFFPFGLASPSSSLSSSLFTIILHCKLCIFRWNGIRAWTEHDTRCFCHQRKHHKFTWFKCFCCCCCHSFRCPCKMISFHVLRKQLNEKCVIYKIACKIAIPVKNVLSPTWRANEKAFINFRLKQSSSMQMKQLTQSICCHLKWAFTKRNSVQWTQQTWPIENHVFQVFWLQTEKKS